MQAVEGFSQRVAEIGRLKTMNNLSWLQTNVRPDKNVAISGDRENYERHEDIFPLESIFRENVPRKIYLLMKIVCFSATENLELLNNKLVRKKAFSKTRRAASLVFHWNREGVEMSENSTLTFQVISCVFGDEKVSLKRGNSSGEMKH
jgi:hypothetical protein